MNLLELLPVGSVMMLGALVLPFTGKRAAWGALLLSVLSFLHLLVLPADLTTSFAIFDLTLTPIRLDSLSRLFAIVFHTAAIIASLYALHVDSWRQPMAAMLYAGASILAATTGDMVTLFVGWELTAIASVFLVWADGTDRSYRAGMRYLVIQVGSGVLLLSGVIIRYVKTGSIAFTSLVESISHKAAELSHTAAEHGGHDHGTGDHGHEASSFFEGLSTLDPAAALILVAFGIKAAFPLLHNWLQDSYPKSTATGTVYLSAFTTKLAIYALIRGFAGFEPLITIGCVMTLFPIVFAVIENDLRRVLAYSLNNQLGFMVVGVGIGSQLAINGAVAHAFCHIIYKSLLFMSMGAVLYRVGTTKATELGGLHRSMPWTTIFCIIGAAAISGFPLLSGFISKSMIISAAAEEHRFWTWIVLLIASAGVMEHSGIKIPFFAFFAHDSGKRVKEAPWHMLAAMGIAAAFCVGLGLAYPLLYRLLPYPADYHPYTVTHVVTQLQLLLFASLAFVVLMRSGVYPEEKRAEVLDTDVFYRRLLPPAVGGISRAIAEGNRVMRSDGVVTIKSIIGLSKRAFGPAGFLSRAWSTGMMTFWATLMLAFYLILYYMELG